MGWLIASIVSGLMFIIGVFSSIQNPTNAGNKVVAVLMFILSIAFCKKYLDSKNGVTARKKEQLKIKEEEKKEKSKLIPGSKERMKELKAELCISAKHMAGLPIAEGAHCYIYLCKDKIIFERNETIYNLTIDKINDVTIKSDVEIQKSYVSSVVGAVGGAMVFGPLGAMIGGRAKEKRSTTINNYLIFTYDKDGNTDYISFDVTGASKAIKFVQFFQSIPKDKKTIDL